MNEQTYSVVTAILGKLASVVALLGTLLVGAGVPAISQHFGASALPNVSATSTLPAMTSYLPYFSSYNAVDGSYVLSSTTVSFTNTSTQIGNNTTYNSLNLWVMASTTFLGSTSSQQTLGPLGATTSTTSTVQNITSGIPTNGLAVGDPCFGSLNASSVSPIQVSCWISSVATTTASATVVYSNASTGPITIPATTTILRLEIHHFPF